MKILNTLLFLTLFCNYCYSQHIWTFDCDMQEWGNFGHEVEFVTSYNLADTLVTSNHLKLKHKPGSYHNWLFGPVNTVINADENKHLHFSLTLNNAGIDPDSAINALFVWTPPGDISTLHTRGLTIYSGQKNYHIDLSEHPDWKGSVSFNRFHFPQGDYTSKGYNPETAEYYLDWVAITQDSVLAEPVQDSSSSCIVEIPELTNPETVVFGNRVSMKNNVTGVMAQAQIKFWNQNGDTIVRNQNIINEAEIFFSFCDLKLSNEYFWQVIVSNVAGADTTDVQEFMTEDTCSEDFPMKYWMTPSPFDLVENVNDDLYGLDNWEEAAELAHVYKIHGATYYGTEQFDMLNFPKLLYAVNKHRMRLALEAVVGGNKNGQSYANTILNRIKEIENLGGKIEFFTWDGMLFRNFYATHTNTKFRSPLEGLEAVAEATRIIKDTYPDFEIIPLPNLPNWNIKDANGQIIQHNAGDWSAMTGIPSWDYLCDIYLGKLAEKGVTINFIEIDHPFNYYHRISREESAKRIGAMDDYCTKNDLELIYIINTSLNGMSAEATDAKFKADCLQYLKDLREDGFSPKYIDLESWYPYPQYLTPETKENSFTNVLRDLGRDFVDNPTSNSLLYEAGTNNMNTVRVFPNPVKNKLYIKIPKNIGPVNAKLVTLNGITCKTLENMKPGTTGFAINDIPEGVYLLRLSSKNNLITLKIKIAE